MDPRPDLQATFWDARAPDYPAARDPAMRARVRRRLEALPAPARPAAGRSVLDVGAGTGAFAIEAAARGAEVAALDLSRGMLARLAAEAEATPIATVCADWRTLDPDAMGWRRRFDIVAAQMVPSFRAASDFARMEACARGWCVFIGWGRRRDDPWLEAAFAAHGVAWTVPPGVPSALELLATLGRHPAPTYLHETWTRDRSTEAAVRDAADHLLVRGITADRAHLARLAADLAIDGRIVDAAEVEIGVLAWPV